MKKFFLLINLIAPFLSFGATGNASDGELTLMSAIAILMLPVVVFYVFRFAKSQVHELRERRLLKKQMTGHNGDFGD